jgi:hypothetical protein
VRPVRIRAAAWCLVVTLAASLGRAQASAPIPARPLEIPEPPVMAKLEQDGVLLEASAAHDGSRGGHAEALVLFQQPRDRVLELLTATERQTEYRPELKRLELVESSDRGDLAEYHVRFLLTKLRYRTRHGWDLDAGRVWWTLDPDYPNGLRTLDGLWELRALDERRTLGRFTSRIDIGPALPSSLQDYATRRRLPEAMEMTRRWVDSGGRWRP